MTDYRRCSSVFKRIIYKSIYLNDNENEKKTTHIPSGTRTISN